MASSPLPIPTAKTTSLLSHKILLSGRNSCWKSGTGTGFSGQKPRQTYDDFMARTASRDRARRQRLGAVRASLGGLLGGLFKGADTGEAARQRYSDTVALINGLEPEMSRLSDSQLRERTSVLKERAQNDESLDSLLPVSLFLLLLLPRSIKFGLPLP